MPPELLASSAGGLDNAEILSNDSDRRSGDVDCWAWRSEVRESGGRGRDFVGVVCAKSSVCVDFGSGGGVSVRCFDFERAGGCMGAAGRSESFGDSEMRLGAPTSRLPCLPWIWWVGRTGVRGGVASSASRTGSSWMTLDVSDAYALGSGVLASVDTPESAPSLCLRRSTTRFLRFRTCPVRDRLAPRLSPADMEFVVVSEGLESCVSLPVLPEATDDAPDFMLPNVDCIRDRLPRVRPGVTAPDSALSG